MRYPQVVILEADGWLAKQLRELAEDSRWLIREERAAADALARVRERRPAVLLAQIEPGDGAAPGLALIADAHRLAPDVPAVAFSDVKLPDADRAVWTALVMDLGARYVLFPPLTKPVLEDVVSGLMAAAVRRLVPGAPPAPPPRREPDAGGGLSDDGGGDDGA